MTNEEILPCPFCGAQNPKVYQSGGYWKVKCIDGCEIAIVGYVKRASAIGAWNKRPEQGTGDGSEDRLYKAAKSLIDYHRAYGPDMFRAQFGSLDVLDVCQQVVQEGEGKPHPWPGEE